MSKVKKQYDGSFLLMHDLIGGKWKLRILWHILHGANRFSILEKEVTGISQKVLYTQLRELEESRIIGREVITDTPPKVVIYHFNHEFKELEEYIEGICTFSERYAKKYQIII